VAAIERFPVGAARAFRLALALAAVLGVMPAGPASGAVPDRAVDAIAGEILRGLDAADLDAVPAGSGYTRPTIAIKAFADDGGPVDAADANHVNDQLMMALQRHARGRFRFVASDAVGDLIANIDATTEPSAERHARLRDLQANLRADILIRGTIRQTSRGAVLTYQAVASETGLLFVATTPLVMSALPYTQAPTDGTGIAKPRPPVSGNPVLPARHSTVLEAERLLVDLGYDPGPADGVLTDRTRAALRAYQNDSALPVNGRMTWRVVENMRRDTR
jgi:hypothetical protein